MSGGHVIKHKIARLIAYYNKENKTVSQVMCDFHFGLRIEDGDLSNPGEIVRAISIIDDLFNNNKISKKEMIDIKTNIIKKLEKYEFSLKKEEPDLDEKERIIEEKVKKRSEKAANRILQSGN